MRNVHVSHLPNKRKSYSIVIPAAGPGIRLSSTVPTSLLPIGKHTLFQRQVNYISREFPKYEIILVGGFEYKKLSQNARLNRRIKLVNNKDYRDTNVVHSINLGLKKAKNDNVLIMYGDLVFNAYMLKLPLDTDSIAVTAESQDKDKIGCTVVGKKVTRMFYGLKTKWSQLLYLTGNELSLFSDYCSDPTNSKSFGFEAVNHVINQGGFIKQYSPKRGKIIDIDSPKDLKHIENTIK